VGKDDHVAGADVLAVSGERAVAPRLVAACLGDIGDRQVVQGVEVRRAGAGT
jgi:hypothetical protein